MDKETQTRHAFYLNNENQSQVQTSDTSSTSETEDEYEIKIKTGKIKGGGTTSDLQLTLIGECNT